MTAPEDAALALLSAIPARLSRAEIARSRPDLLPHMAACGRAWAAYAAELGIACPPALVTLADAMGDVFVHVADDHGWDLLTPADAREARRGLADLAAALRAQPLPQGPIADAIPSLEARARMAPVFGQDGDLLLLAADGRVHAFTHDAFEDDGVVAESFDALLRAIAERLSRR